MVVSKTQSDVNPKRPDRVVEYSSVKKIVKEEDEEPDYLALLAMLLGFIGLFMRYKLASWGSVFAAMSSVANLKTANADWKQIITSVMFSIMSLVFCYINQFAPGQRKGIFG
eukprot:TRINITY_DN847_c0_g1_i1.p1 TRINITY_DN847_c0_g1~~TRINITY_DN847_c0_g1_i1.p1  ORF type:complete len:112 (+),score=6.99 TRINITY_DN847_c0_g1_i1:163-498(+)